MAKDGHTDHQDGDVGTEGRAGGVQLPMEISFITVKNPGQRIPYSQLSQITAHAMRKSHERRRGLESKTTRIRQPQQVARSGSYNHELQVQGPRDPSHDNIKHPKSRKEIFSKQQCAATVVPSNTDERPGTLEDRPHSELQTPPRDIISHVTPNHPASAKLCDCTHCRAQALLRDSLHPDMIFGGYRSDPFLRYPIPFQSYFPAAVDHCKEVVSPDQAFFKLVITHDVLFEAIISWVLYTTLAHTPELRKAALFHYGATLSKVREGLLTRGSTRRAVMAAISNLGGICVGDLLSRSDHQY